MALAISGYELVGGIFQMDCKIGLTLNSLTALSQRPWRVTEGQQAKWLEASEIRCL